MTRASLRDAAALAAPPLLVLTLAQWAPARGVIPVLGLLHGPLATGLVMLVAGASLARAFRVRWSVPRTSPWRLFVVAALVYGSLGAYYAGRLQASGDEPHYLVMAQSLWKEGDLDLRDNYERQDFLDYTPGPLQPHYGAPRADGRPFPAHSPGLPLLLAPAYAAGGRSGALLLIVLAAAALTVEAYRLARSLAPDGDAALLAWSGALAAPVAFYAFHVYTEVPSALAIALALRLLLLGSGGMAAAVGAGLAASALPWLHVKLLPAAAVLGAIGLIRLRGRPRWVFLGVAMAMAVGFALYYEAIFARPTPLAIYGGVPRAMSGQPWRALLGLSLDRSFGLLPVAPLFLLGCSGLAVWGRRGAAEVWPWAALLGAVVLPLLWWRMWWGGYCPPARFLVPAVPILTCAIAVRAAASPRGLARWRWALAALGLALAAYSVHRPVDRLLLDRRDQPTRLWTWLADFEEPSLNRYLPSLVARSDEEVRVAIVWVAGLTLLLGLDVLARRRERADRLFVGFALPLALFLAGGALVDGWARAGAPAEPAPPSASGSTSSWSPVNRFTPRGQCAAKLGVAWPTSNRAGRRPQ